MGRIPRSVLVFVTETLGRESAVATRLSVNIRTWLPSISITEVIRRAVGVYKYIEDEVTINHKVLKLVSDEEVTTLTLVP
jgi:hypothetical protein